MKLSKKVKEAIGRKRLTYSDLQKWNAFRGLKASRKRLHLFQSAQEDKKLMSIQSEKNFKKWAGLGDRTEGTFREVLDWKINPHFILWTILRVDFLPPSYMHHLALFFCRDFHERLAKEGTYIDFRYQSSLQDKQDWIKRKLSLGNLKHQQRTCSQYLVDMHASKDDKMIAAAAATHAVMSEDGRAALLDLFSVINGIFSLKKEDRFRLKVIKDQII